MKFFDQRGLGALAAAAVLIAAAPAAARPSWRRPLARAESPLCSASYTRAGERVREARLKEASELYALCARTACSEDMRRECAARRAQVEADTPSLVPLVTDDAGEPRILVEVRIDGALVTSRLDGRALSVDPGKHELAFSTDAGVFATRHLMVVQGERNRAIHVVLHASDEGGLKAARELAPAPRGRPEAPAPAAREGAAGDSDDDAAAAADAPRAARPEAPDVATKHAAAGGGPGAAPYLLGALGLAGVGGFGLLTYWGRADNALLAGCAPSCTDASVRHVRQLYWAADASLGVGIVSLAVSTWLFSSHGVDEAAPAPGPVSLDVRATSAGGVATLAGRF
jgi:hypothetical protein